MHVGVWCRFAFHKKQLPMGLCHLQLHFHLIFGDVFLQRDMASAWRWTLDEPLVHVPARHGAHGS